MSVRKAISGSVSYKDLISAGKKEENIDEEEMKIWGMGLCPLDVVEPELTPTEATKEIAKPLVLAVEDGGK